MQEVGSSQMPAQLKGHCYDMNIVMLVKLEKDLPASRLTCMEMPLTISYVLPAHFS